MTRLCVRAGFDPEDRTQEAAIAIWRAEQRYPGDRRHAQLRAREAVARHKRREAKYHKLHVPLKEANTAAKMDKTFERVLIREILDLLPVALADEVLTALATADGRKIRRAGRKAREALYAEKQKTRQDSI